MLVIGVTGGSGCGKSNVARILSKKGLYHIDCDIVARKVVEPGTECLIELVKFFGKQILNDDGTLNRRGLANIAFSSEDNTKKLNDITLKYIIKYIKDLLSKLEKQGEIAALLDGATLIESGLHNICDYNIAVIAPKENRIKRIMDRDGISFEEAKRRISAQKEDSFYTDIADFVVVNDSTLDNLSEKTNDIYNQLAKTEDWNETQNTT